MVVLNLFKEDPDRARLREEALADARARLAEGMTVPDLVKHLHDRGLTIVDSAAVIRFACQTTLGQAKDIVTVHPVWENLVQMTEPLHDELQKWAESGGLENGTP